MAHIAFFTIADAGHVNPTLAVVAELVRRRHRVSYATTREFADRVVRAGAHQVCYTSTMVDSLGASGPSFANDRHFTGQDLARLQHARLEEAVVNLPALARSFASDQPDIVVFSAPCWAGRLLAARWSVPSIRSIPTFANNEQWSLGRNYTRDDTSDPGLATVYGGVARLVERLGVPTDPAEFFTDGGDTSALVYLPRAFQYAGDTFPPNVHFVGPCLAPHGFHGSWQPPAGAPPTVLVSLGTAYNNRLAFFRTCIDAFAELDWHAVIALGGRLSADRLGHLPVNVEVHDFLPQLDVLRHARAFVNHAGMGSVMESIAAGVPVVAVPQMPEQQANADRISQLGLGIRLSNDELTAQRVRDSVRAVTADRDVSDKIADMRREIDRAGGATAAADVITHALAGRPVAATRG